MLHTSLGYILVRSFPECAILLLAGCNFLNLQISAKTLFKKTLFLGLIISLVRMLPISFGIHTIIGMAFILLVLVNLSNNSFVNCIMALCKVFLCLILSEFFYIKLITVIFSLPKEILIDNYSIMGAIYSLPSLVIFAILAFVMEFVTQKLRVESGVRQSGEFNGKSF
ncbi:hypothetical protein [Terrisporobacter sp.]